ncbi:tail fiber protein [Pseudoalteromonas sp. SCSIO 43201]|uniref:phage tail protein n=1 Tax=Pseudoalteromonas TaxID=53246 RepID=UPI0020753292|nr:MULTISPECIES: tail fiber protein [Pseudoalteromonas]MDW7550560.1 tail fiber protein [Pseudoalteromonas peptidolytica]USD30014.1 tail fiber protein [Pseudoalteromonas sp. SCSIO 43201]
MSDGVYIGEIEMVGYSFIPRGYFACGGGIISIGSSSALYSLLGTMYGGDGRVSFGLPDFRGRGPIGDGAGPGLTYKPQGGVFGYENNYLNVTQLPAHSHTAIATAEATSVAQGFVGNLTVNAKNGLGNTDDANGAYWATGELVNGRVTTPITKAYSTTSDVQMAGDAVQINGGFSQINTAVDVKVDVGSTGASSPIPNYQPSIVVKFVIADIGIYPSRS